MRAALQHQLEIIVEYKELTDMHCLDVSRGWRSCQVEKSRRFSPGNLIRRPAPKRGKAHEDRGSSIMRHLRTRRAARTPLP